MDWIFSLYIPESTPMNLIQYVACVVFKYTVNEWWLKKKNSNNSYNASDDTNDWNYWINKFINSLIHVCTMSSRHTKEF